MITVVPVSLLLFFCWFFFFAAFLECFVFLPFCEDTDKLVTARTVFLSVFTHIVVVISCQNVLSLVTAQESFILNRNSTVLGNNGSLCPSSVLRNLQDVLSKCPLLNWNV